MSPDLLERLFKLEKMCRTRGVKMGLAESCTGGLLSNWLCAYPGASTFYQGGIVAYSGEVKRDVLKIPAGTLKVYGEVSLPVAKAMASGARQALGCEWAVSITGIAGPGGGSPDKPVGFVCFAVSGPGFEEAVHKQFPAGAGRQDIQRQAALFAFDLLLNAMR